MRFRNLSEITKVALCRRRLAEVPVVVTGEFMNARIANPVSDFFHGEIRAGDESAGQAESDLLDPAQRWLADSVPAGAGNGGGANTTQANKQWQVDDTGEVTTEFSFEFPPQPRSRIEIVRSNSRHN